VPRAKRKHRPTPVPVEAAIFLTVGVPADPERNRLAVRRAGEALEREGFTVGVTSDDAVMARASQIEIERAKQRREKELTKHGG
jgi:hypothetical protein